MCLSAHMYYLQKTPLCKGNRDSCDGAGLPAWPSLTSLSDLGRTTWLTNWKLLAKGNSRFVQCQRKMKGGYSLATVIKLNCKAKLPLSLVVQGHSFKPRWEIVSWGKEMTCQECDGVSLYGKNKACGLFLQLCWLQGDHMCASSCNGVLWSWEKALWKLF